MNSSIRKCLCKILLVCFQITNIFEATPKNGLKSGVSFAVKSLIYFFIFFFKLKGSRFLLFIQEFHCGKEYVGGVQISVKIEHRYSTEKQYEEKKYD